MKSKSIWSLTLLLFCGCAQTSTVTLNESKKYAPSVSVMILEVPPLEPYEVLALLETRGAVGQSLPALLENMRNEAREIGADAIIPVEENSEQVPQGIMYNEWIGGYQTFGGGRIPIVRGYAIILERSKTERALAYRKKREVGFGVTANSLPIILNGYGIGVYVGKKRFRAFVDYFSLDVPSVFLRDGFADGRVESGFNIGVDYFFMDDLEGLYFGSGVGYSKNRTGHQDVTEIGKWESLNLAIGFGYLLKLHEVVHLDARLSLGARVGGENEIDVGGHTFVPDEAIPSAFLGIGINF